VIFKTAGQGTASSGRLRRSQRGVLWCPEILTWDLRRFRGHRRHWFRLDDGQTGACSGPEVASAYFRRSWIAVGSGPCWFRLNVERKEHRWNHSLAAAAEKPFGPVRLRAHFRLSSSGCLRRVTQSAARNSVNECNRDISPLTLLIYGQLHGFQ
jgi:hypothetical protein